MTIDEAIKNLSRISYSDRLIIKYDIDCAIKLGIEALKRVKDCRLGDDMIADRYLPGETK
ncbi:unnamed protein product [marine sediment metagenome]|uniref:Uncharacterized protein n=1 Tax=marine sediment metagenome TaxID=412755 RepID=X1RGD5_9ZZZZ